MRKRILISIGLIFSIHLIASEENYAYETLAEDLSHPWGLAVIDENNIDPPSIEIKQVNENYELHFWDGYSQSEVVENLKEKEITKSLRRFFKKINKYLDVS